MLPLSPRVSNLSRAFRDPIVPASTAVQEAPSVALADLIRMLAEGIADAQTELDRASAEMIVDLANTRVDVVRSVTETIAEDGSVQIVADAPENLSLLELGVQPTFYQFAESTIEVAMDLEIAEEIEEESKGRKSLFARTRNITTERKLNRDVSVSSKVTTRLVPVPSPIRLEVTRNAVTADADDGDDDA